MKKQLAISLIGTVAFMGVGIFAFANSFGERSSEANKQIMVASYEALETVNPYVESTPEVTTMATEQPTESPKPIICLSDKETELMLHIAMAEAGIEDVKGKTLVMNVVWNRVKSGEFPDSIKEVIYQKKQFAVIANGSFDNAVPDNGCYEALQKFIYGSDDSDGALYFESKSASTWHEDNLQFLFKHGRHYFYTDKED